MTHGAAVRRAAAEPKISQFEISVLREENIGRLDVAVDDELRVDRRERRSELLDPIDDTERGEGAAELRLACNRPFERAARREFRHDAEHLARHVDEAREVLNDVRMAEGREVSNLMREAITGHQRPR